jgi:hypothetical protein
VTQTVAEELKALRLLGAAFFFLKESNHYDDPTGIIASLAYQLALSHREYGRVVGEILSKDPTILGKGLALQFKQLLVEPFSTIMIQSACTTPKPVVVVLDGLDQYHDKQVQCEIVRLIGRYSQRDDFPLMWIISSRPEWHLVHLEPPVACIHENLCYLGRRDVEIYIKDGLRKIAQTYPELIEAWGTWPKGGDVYRLIKGAGDLFTVAKSILDFISSPKYSDPSLRLCLLLNFIANPSLTVPSITDNPFASIYAQYLSALSHFPRSLLPVVLQVFGLWCTQPSLTAFELANMLAIDRGTLHYILRHLHGIVRLSYDYDHNRQFLKHIHPSFLTFFSNPCLLHNNGLTPKISSTRISSAIARPLLDLLKPRLQIAQNRLSWKSQPPQGFTRQSLAIRDLAVSNEIVAWAMRLAWGFCAKIELSQSEYQNRFWYNYFVNFNFGQLGEDCGGCGRIPSTEFRAFLRWLYRLSIRCRPREHLIVRTSPSYPLDQEFIDKCEGIAEPLVWFLLLCCLIFKTTKGLEDCKSTVTPASVKYALLGVNSKSTLVLLTSDSVTVYSLNHLDDI